MLLGVIMLVTGCEVLQDNIAKVPDEDTTASISADELPPDETKVWGEVVILNLNQLTSDDYQLNSAAINADTLTINASYGGGCELHQFTLVASGAFVKVANGPTLPVRLIHNANRDPCEAWLTEDYHFDLTPIKTLYQTVYGQETGTITLLITGTPRALTYSF